MIKRTRILDVVQMICLEPLSVCRANTPRIMSALLLFVAVILLLKQVETTCGNLQEAKLSLG